MARTLRFDLIITITNLYELLGNTDSPRDDCLNICMLLLTFVHYFVVLFSFDHLCFLCLAVILTIRVAHSLVSGAGVFSELCHTVYCVCAQCWCIFWTVLHCILCLCPVLVHFLNHVTHCILYLCPVLVHFLNCVTLYTVSNAGAFSEMCHTVYCLVLVHFLKCVTLCLCPVLVHSELCHTVCPVLVHFLNCVALYTVRPMLVHFLNCVTLYTVFVLNAGAFSELSH